ncbi:unnamed protein product [Symbiodinium sp. KB8]|nr:unnamed protein product [Symbiodinium sp. KB8]
MYARIETCDKNMSHIGPAYLETPWCPKGSHSDVRTGSWQQHSSIFVLLTARGEVALLNPGVESASCIKAFEIMLECMHKLKTHDNMNPSHVGPAFLEALLCPRGLALT